MAITQAICATFKSELLTGIHDFAASGGDTFKLALYTSAAMLSSATTIYTASGEVPSSGTGYTAGGEVLTNLGVTLSGTTAYIDFSNVEWTSATFTTAGALIYNASKSNKAVAVFNFGIDYPVSNGTFSLLFPPPSPTTAVIYLN